jgi:2-methylisocitrate lyase-like PEP mutase family enzyme
MSSQKGIAEQFNLLHIKGEPLVLFNIWDSGSARAVEEAGAKAIATGSWSVAAANGFADGEELLMEIALENAKRIVANTTLPVSLDFEGGYAASLEELKTNIQRVIDAGAVGINFEDQIVGGDGLYSIEQQSARIAAIRETAESKSIPLFINARTDVFLKTYPAVHTDEQLENAIGRATAYANAGASGFFAPGLRNPEMIKTLCERSSLPVNIMVLPDTPTNKEMAELGVARISYGPGPYRLIIESLKTAATAAFSF